MNKGIFLAFFLAFFLGSILSQFIFHKFIKPKLEQLQLTQTSQIEPQTNVKESK